MKLKAIPANLDLEGQRILMRVDWNVPLNGFPPQDLMKIERTVQDIRELSKRGAIVILLTHLGRPKKRDRSLSTARLLPAIKHHYRLAITHHSASISNPKERAALKAALSDAKIGSIHLLENVRFEKEEEENKMPLIKAYAELGDIYVNDAFASCHRKHATVVGLAKALPAYAGPDLVHEVEALSTLLDKPKAPFVAVIGGLKLSTKIPILKDLCRRCDRVLIGGAMANVFLAIQGIKLGASFVEKSAMKEAKQILAKYKKKISLPVDVMCVTNPNKRQQPVRRHLADIGAKEIEIDLGPETLVEWAKILKTAKTIIWNGPVGKVEVLEYAFGSRFLARTIGAYAKGSCFGVAGGGDTVPTILETNTQTWYDHVSMGGGAMLEFITKKGKLPGLEPLWK